MKKLTLYIFLAAFIISAAFSQSADNAVPGTTQLLLSYIENDTELKNLTIAAKKASLSYDSTKIDNGFDVTLSSGTVTIKLADDGTKVTAKPSVKASLPQASNLSAEVQSNVTCTGSTAKVSDTAISVGVDIISSSNIKSKVSLLKAERSVTEAKRKLEKRVLTAEKEFYTELKSLLSSIESIMNLKDTYYTDMIDFESKKIQGYAKTSSTYRKAELKVISDQHDIESNLHTLIYNCVVFYKKCGYDISISEDMDLMKLVPTDIEVSEPLNILDFNKENFTSIESANWTYKINSLERSADKNYSLSANAGYTFSNSTTNSDSVDAGLSGSVGGLTLGAGVSIPVAGSNPYPAVTVSMSLTPNTFRKNSITKQQNSLTEEQELLSIQAAESEYATKVVETQQKLESLLWEQKSIEDNLKIFEEMEKDMAIMYQQGFTTESEYLSAKSNLNSYIIKQVENKLDLIMYNTEVVTNFVSEESNEKTN